MEVAEVNDGTGVQKSSTAVSESSHEVSIEKTASGSIEQEVSAKRSLEQSVEKSESIQKSVQQQSSQVIQKSVSSSVSGDKPDSNNPEQNGEANPPSTPVKKQVSFDDNKKVIIESDDNDNRKEFTEESKKSSNGDGGNVEVTETVRKTVIVRRGSKPDNENEQVQTVIVKKLTQVKKNESIEEKEKEKLEEVKEELNESETVEEKKEIKKPEESVKSKVEEVKEEQKAEKELEEEEEEEEEVEEVEEEEEEVEEEVEVEEVEEEVKEEVEEKKEKEKENDDKNGAVHVILKAPPRKESIPEEINQIVRDQSKDQMEKTPIQSRRQSQIEYQLQIQNVNTYPQNAMIEQDNYGYNYEQQSVLSGEQMPQHFPWSQQQPQQQAQPTQYSSQQSTAGLFDQSYQHFPQHAQKPQQYSYVQPPVSEIKQESIKNALKEIISDIDRVIEKDEEKSHVVLKSSTQEQSNDDSSYITNRIYERTEFQESSSAAAQKSINLKKLFTPATDGEEILPKNRKLYASSAFYSPTLHPTVEDQVELARRISHSLSDISNQQSKGQSMYVNRKKRSVKWVHEGEGKRNIQEYSGYSEDSKENGYESKISTSSVHHEKLPLKLVMNPHGQVRDYSSVQDDLNTSSGLLSPDKCQELISALQAPIGKGAELFAKRRKKAENWVVDETTAATRSPSGVPYGHPAPSSTSPNVPPYSDHAQRFNTVRSPWEAALETAAPANTFEEYPRQQDSYLATAQSQQQYFPVETEPSPLYKSCGKQQYPVTPNNQRDLAYKPCVPQGWNAPPPDLPTVNSTDQSQSNKVQAKIQSMASSSGKLEDFVYKEENYSQSDEDEIIQFMERTKLRRDEESLSQDEFIKQNYVNCIAKSPELMVSNARESYQKYDNTIKEFKTSIFKHHQSEQNMKKTKVESTTHQQTQNTINRQKEQGNGYQIDQVSVRSQEQKQQNFQNFYLSSSTRNAVDKYNGKEIKQDNENRVLTEFQVKSDKSRNERQQGISAENQKSIQKQEKVAIQQDKKDEEEDEEYKKIPVKDLISSFEKQTRPIMNSQPTIKRRTEPISNGKQNHNDFRESNLKRQEYQTKIVQDVRQDTQINREITTAVQENTSTQELFTPPQIPLDYYETPSNEYYLPRESSSSAPVFHTSTSTSFPSYHQPESQSQQYRTFPITKPVYSQQQQYPQQQQQQQQLQFQSQGYSYSGSNRPSTSSWSPQHDSNTIRTVTPFNPSPLPYEKLARFENPEHDEINQTQVPLPSFRRLVASLTPAASVPRITPTFPLRGAKYIRSPDDSRPVNVYGQQQQQYNQDYPQHFSQGKVISNDEYDQQQPSQQQRPIDLSQFQNYNTAPRGWNDGRDYYRPVTFEKPADELPYTDF